MKKYIVFLLAGCMVLLSALRTSSDDDVYDEQYKIRYNNLVQEFQLLDRILNTDVPKSDVHNQIKRTRLALKKVDTWLRYTNPIAHKFLNGPLPVEWEVEVFEKWEKPYRRDAAGLTLLQLAIDENAPRGEWNIYIEQALDSLAVFEYQNIRNELHQRGAMYFANRLHLLNLATIYSTGFECPNTDLAIPEIATMLQASIEDYKLFNKQYSEIAISGAYLSLYQNLLNFVISQPQTIEEFDHYTFMKDFVNPLFTLNQLRIQELKLTSRNVNDYSLSNDALSIFDKSLYKGMENKGVFKGLSTNEDLDRLYTLGEQLFNDPILSFNNERSCASCHKPDQFFNDTTVTTALQIDKITRLPRNTPSLVGSLKNHLLMLDGRHINPAKQADDVMQNPTEMGLGSKEILPKVLRIPTYKKELSKLAKKTINKQVSKEHIFSAIIFYYSSLDTASSSFDKAMNTTATLSDKAIQGFNLFMSKAECATCHFAPQYNGVKPPYVSSEFEVVGTPADTAYRALSSDLGRGKVHRVEEMQNAFRTPTLRNLSHTKPYMHNGVFETLDEVLEFYNSGGGVGNGLDIPNQTLNSSNLNLSEEEKDALKAFLLALNEQIQLPKTDVPLPRAKGQPQNRKTLY